MSEGNSTRSFSSAVMFASPDPMSDYESDFSSDDQVFADDFLKTPPNEVSQSSYPRPARYSEYIASLVTDFYRSLSIRDAEAAANTAQGEASKIEPPLNFQNSAPTVQSEPETQVNTNGFGGGKVICHIIPSEDAVSRERRIMQESTFKLQPAPLWTRKSKSVNRMVPFKEIKVGADHDNLDGDAKETLSAPQPTAKVSSWLKAIPGTSSVFENLFEASEPWDFRCAGPCLSSLDSFNGVFEMKGFESGLSFEVPDPHVRASLAMRALAVVLEELAKHV